jgi:chromate reductase, NAD(P)H dehydrogenase (quinone)
MTENFKILGIVGSLREKSLHKVLMLTAVDLAPEGVTIEPFYLHGIPIFNQDIEMDPPEAVKTLKRKIREADAIIIASPEYNYSVSGVLKNALDWASRPHGDNPFDEKPVAIMSGGATLGGARAQYHLRQIMLYDNAHTLNRPEVIIPFIHEKIDPKTNRITDEKTTTKIKEQIIALKAWADRLKK